MNHRRAILVIAACACSGGVHAQSTTYELTPDAGWKQTAAPDPASDEGIIASARRELAAGRHSAARSIANQWLKQNERRTDALVAEALMIRGDARTAGGDEFNALYDYEEICERFPGTDHFVRALERELDIGVRYLNGLRRKFLGLRIDPAESIGEELLVRVQERLPGSALAERAAIELADYYYRERDLAQAAEMYGIFVNNYPRSRHLQHAMQRRIYANIARFKGPAYDASGLREATLLIRDYADRYPQDAERAGMNDGLIARLDESIAAQMLTTAEWYLNRSDRISARHTLRALLAEHPQTVAASRALAIMEREGFTPAPAAEPEQAPAEPSTPE